MENIPRSFEPFFVDHSFKANDDRKFSKAMYEKLNFKGAMLEIMLWSTFTRKRQK